MSEHIEATKTGNETDTPIITPQRRIPSLPTDRASKRIPNLTKPQNQSQSTQATDDFNSMSPEQKVTYLKTKIARAEANLNYLKRNADINKTVDNIVDWKRQLNILTSTENKELLVDLEEDNIDVFELINLNAKQVATKRSNALIVTGHPGIGKTMTVIQAIAFLNPHSIIDSVIRKETEDTEDTEINLDGVPNEDLPILFEVKEEVKEEIKVEVPEVKQENKPKVPKLPNINSVKDIKRMPSLNVNKKSDVKVVKPASGSRNNTESGYFIASGACTAAALYELLFIHRKKTLVLDDFDSVLKDPECVNLLKAALDTYPIREISRMTKGNTFNSFGMSDAEMEEKYELDGKLPNQFRFVGTIIFVSNIHEEKFDKALISRALHVEVRLSRQQVIERMTKIIPDIAPEVPIEYKLEALNYLDFLTSNYKCKFPLDIRQLIHTINNRTAYPPEDPENVKESRSGKKIYVWQQMAKERLIERVFKY